jgi:hypothetical protein
VPQPHQQRKTYSCTLLHASTQRLLTISSLTCWEKHTRCNVVHSKHFVIHRLPKLQAPPALLHMLGMATIHWCKGGLSATLLQRAAALKCCIALSTVLPCRHKLQTDSHLGAVNSSQCSWQPGASLSCGRIREHIEEEV